MILEYEVNTRRIMKKSSKKQEEVPLFTKYYFIAIMNFV